MKRKKPDRHDNIRITAAQPDRIPSEMDSTQNILPPVNPSEDPKGTLIRNRYRNGDGSMCDPADQR